MHDDSAAAARYAREREFHDHRFGHDDTARARADKYYAADAGRAAYASQLDTIPAGARVLEYGCGQGSAAYDLAARGVEVVAIDISPEAIAGARSEAARRGLTGVRFEEMNAEALALPDGHFDWVCGTGILHHLDLDRAWREISRVLAPGGAAVFLEPMGTNPLINLYRRLTPSMRTPDEHPLVFDDIRAVGAHFEQVSAEFFNFLGLAGAFLQRLPHADALMGWLHAADQWLFTRFPWTRRFAWVVVVSGHDPIAS
jgi:SAM-dependent methyltransferase